VLSGGSATSTIVSSGGELAVSSGATEQGAVISNGGLEIVVGGGSASGTMVSAGGVDFVFGSASNTTVMTDGAEYVYGTVNGATINGGLLYLRGTGTAGTSQINFASGAGGTLELDRSVAFNGVISGFGVPGGIDLRDISFLGSGTTLGYADSGTSGTLTISDGTNTATLHLLGHYTAANFVTQADGNGGTLVTDPPVVGQYSLYNPHA
jgi:autotransporter passenger strand-loop-strand repeat protein